MSKCCMDCGYYVAGALERNCSYPWAKRQNSSSCVCAIQEACKNFTERRDAEDLSMYPPINLRTKIRQRKLKSDKL